MALQPLRNFVTWNSGSLLVPPTPPNVWNDIPTNALMIVPKFTREDLKTPSKHLQDVFDVYMIHNITEQNVSLRLLATSFKDKAQD